MPTADLGEIRIHYRIDGAPDGAPVVLAHSLGTDLRLWDDLVPLLPKGLKLVRYDLRGHGQSSVPPAPYAMGALIRDAETLLDWLGLRDCAFVGVGIGGLVAQGLAIKRLDLVRALVLSGTAAKIGTPARWQDRIAVVRTQGTAALADDLLARWFARKYRSEHDLSTWRDMLILQPAQGYVGCCAAMSGTDLFTPTSGLRLPTLGLAGSEDGVTPPDLVRETVELIRGAQFRLIRRAGHLPFVEQPEVYADALTTFLNGIGHIEKEDRDG